MKILFTLLFVLYCIVTHVASRDPYSVLGVSRSATKSEIQKAYRKLAKKYHPDVSSHPDAEQKFTELAGAYEELTKETQQPVQHRRSGPGGSQQQFYFNGKRFTFSGNDGFGGFHGFNNFQEKQPHKDSPFITVKRFEQEVLPDSYSTIHLVKVTSRWCFLCMEYDKAWPDIMNHFKPYGMKFWELPYDSSNMRQKISVYEIPSFLILLSGRVYHFTKTLTLKNLENFMLSKIQANLNVEQVHDRGVDNFVDDFTDYKVKLIFVSRSFTFMQATAAFKYKDYYKYGFASTEDESTMNIQQLIASPGILIFKEAYPAISRKESIVTIETLLNTMNAEKMLILPKISSPKLFDEVCFVSADQPCVIFILNSKDQYKRIKSLVQSGDLQFKRNTQFSFLYRDSQSDFVEKLNPPSFENNVVMLKRQSANYGQVFWPQTWNFVDQSELYQSLKHAKFSMSTSNKLGTVVNENAPSVFGSILDFIYYSSESFIGQISLISLNTWLSVIMIITLFFVTFLINSDPEELQRQQDQHHDQEQRNEEATFRSAPSVKLAELNKSTVSWLLPQDKSQITLLIIGDLSENKGSIPLAVKVVSAQLKLLARNSRYSVAYASHVKYEPWLLKFAEIADCRLIQGSVIALNLNKKYFYFFTPINSCSNSSLINLQDRFTLWYDRLCEGSLPKYYIDNVNYEF